jgi:hypothetical protein
MIQIAMAQTNGTPLQTYTLQLNSAPLREIWFSTTHGFHPSGWPAASNYVSGGDLVSSTGRIVKRNVDLLAPFSPMPPLPEVGLDAVDLLPGGEIAFSLETDIFSETLGQTLHGGDVLSSRARVITNYAAMIGAFGPEPPAADQGLDALQVLDNGEIYFSIVRDFWSETQSRWIQRGDVLSSRGVVIKTNAALLAAFHPAVPKQDYGLDALCVWPSGEVWFSTETNFYNDRFELFSAGDLLSDQGYVVYLNRELLAAFAPLEDLADFGLDALYLVSDAGPPPPTNTPLRCTGVIPQPATGDVTLQWEGSGRVFQVEKATNILGPWLPLGPIVVEPPLTDQGALSNSPQRFYRLRQW